MSLERLYQKYAGTANTSAPAAKWPCGPAPEPPQSQPGNRVVAGSGPIGPNGPEQVDREEAKPKQTPATPAEIAALISGLKSVGRSLGLVEALAREAMAQLTREAAAELAVVLDDAFEVAPDDATARAHCRRLLNDPQALVAAKAVWPDLPHAPAPTVSASPSIVRPPVVEHAPQWLRLVREHCAVLPEDERLITKATNNRTPQQTLQIAQRYITTWQHAAEQEPVNHKRDNAGRRAANREIAGGRHAG